MRVCHPCRLVGAAAAAAVVGCAGAACDSGATATTSATTSTTATARPAASPGSAAGDAPSPSPSRPAPPASLPRGGRRILPDFRVVALYGSVGGPALGVLGQGTPEQAAVRVERTAAGYSGAGRRVLPAMELITTIASARPEKDGTYSRPIPPDAVASYLTAARRHRMLLILDLQPGRGDFYAQARRYERFLREPDVSLALDAEWKMGATQRPGVSLGHADAASINRVSLWLSGLVRRDRLPQKLLVLHEFTESMLPDRDAIVSRSGLATVFHVDGFGGQSIKARKYADLHGDPPFFSGVKLFLRQDTDMMTPAQALSLRPQPDLVTYQ